MIFDVVSIGNPVYDIIITPYVKTNGRVLSGCSTNSALTIGKLGGRAGIIGCIGDDFLHDFLEITSRYNVKAFPIKSKQTGGFYLKYIDKKMSDRELRVLGVADNISFENIPSEALDSRAIILGPILKEIDLNLVRSLKKETDALIFVDPQGLIREIRDGRVIRITNPDVYEIIKITNITKPNEHEAAVLFPGLDPVKVAQKIYSLNKFVGIVTLAERGSIVAFEKGIYYIPAYRTIERDPTGCGDVYAGAFTFYYLKYGDVLEACVFASAAASFMVEDTGPHFKMSLKDVIKRFERLLIDVRRIK
ncbi:MAG: PfkB family carbohydrate kinase [Candidatus Njordarchaeales archaeon]|mgnify:CR=1 FL=1